MSSTAPPPRRRRLVPGWLLVVLFVAVPLAEIYVLVQVGEVIGVWWTILLLVADSVVGAWLVRREGSRAWQAFREALVGGRMPARELADGALILIGGTLMLTPGFVTDVFGIAVILPFTRPVARRVLTRAIASRLVGADDARRPGPPTEGPVVRGDVVD